MFFIWFLGMFWRRSKAAAVVSLLGSWAVNCVLTRTGLAAVFKLEGNNYSIFMFVISALLYFVTGLFDRNSRCAYKKLYKEQHARYIEKMAERT
jgi:Na+/proline symporter